jgi:hypothetical protein
MIPINFVLHHLPSGSGLALVSIFVGACISYYFYRKSKRETRPTCAFDSLCLLGNQDHLLPDEVQITFGNRSVSVLSRTVLTFWNAGTSLLDGDDIALENGPTVAFSRDAQILKVTRLVETNEANDIELERCAKNPSVAHLSFKYLDSQDGATLEILHTDPVGNPTVGGKIKGIPEGIRFSGFPAKDRARYPWDVGLTRAGRSRFFRGLIIAMTIVGIAAITSSLLPHHPQIVQSPPSTAAPRIGLFIAGAMYVLLSLAVLYRSRRRVPKRLLPD